MNNELFLYMKTFIYVLLLLCSGSVVAQDHFSISVTPGEFTIEKALQEARLHRLQESGGQAPDGSRGQAPDPILGQRSCPHDPQRGAGERVCCGVGFLFP